MKPLYILKDFSKKERLVLTIALAVAVLSGVFTFIHIVGNITIKTPSYGGSFSEGVIGQPSFINPILSKSGTVDQDIVSILFANLITLSSSIKYNEDYTIWNLRIKDDALWQDGSPITSDDIIFTIREIQDPQILSPLFQEWQHINASRVSEREVKFELSSSYPLFKENILSNLRPIPKKNFANLSPANFRLSIYNLEPIGSGPYKYNHLIKRSDGFIENYSFSSNDLFDKIGHTPYINTYSIKFYQTKKDIITAYNNGSVDGFFTDEYSILSQLIPSSKVIDVPTTKYIAMFLNSSANQSLGDINVRKAIATAIDRKNIISTVYNNEASLTNGPIPITFKSYNNALEKNVKYNPNEAMDLISSSGWEYDEDNNIFTKNNDENKEVLSIKITTPDIPRLKSIAEMISTNLNSIGIQTAVEVIDVSLIESQNIKTRDYEALIFGNILSNYPDLHSFWYSSEKFYPGLNLSLYENSDVDDLIMDMREHEIDSEERTYDILEIQDIIAQDFPAVFLLSPTSFYIIRNNIPGISLDSIAFPSDRLKNIENWYVKTNISIK